MNPDEAPRHLDISSSLDSRLVVNTKRTRRPTAKVAAISLLYNLTPLALARCLAPAIASAPTIYHSSSADLPPEPTSHKQAMVHTFATGWMDTEGEEYKAHVLLREQCQLGAADQRLYCYLLSCSVVMFVYRSSHSEVSALAHRAVPATIEYHVI